MTKRCKTEYVHEGRYAAEVDIELLEEDGGWSPYLSLEDVEKLENVRDALRQGDLTAAQHYGRVYELQPVARKKEQEV